MGKFTSLAVGAAQGALATKRYQDTKKRQDRQDEMMGDYFKGRKGAAEADPMAGFEGTPSASLPGNPLSEEERLALNASGMANGGMVGMAKTGGGHTADSDNIAWQRASFKK